MINLLTERFVDINNTHINIWRKNHKHSLPTTAS